MKTLRIVFGVVVVFLTCTSQAQDKYKALATQLSAQCKSECAQYYARANAGSLRAGQEASACLTGCFYNNLPDDYPNLDAILKTHLKSVANAKALAPDPNHPMPVFVTKSKSGEVIAQ